MPAPLPSWGNGAVRFEPASIQDNHDGNFSIEKRGLSLWMKDTWQPATDLESELPARRALLEGWATADQAFSDSYVDWGKALGRWFGPCPSTLLEDIPLKEFVCVAHVDKQTHPDNYKKLLKILILCYMSREIAPKGFKDEHAFDNASWNDPHLPDFPPLPDQTTLDYGLSSIFPENADLRALETTRTGTVVLYSYLWFIIDQEALDTGRVRVVDFAVDGAVRTQALIRPYHISKLRTFAEGLAPPLWELIEGCHIPKYINTPLNLDIPLPDLLHGLQDEMKGWFGFSGDREFWQNAIETVAAPGYLELEAQGRELEYDIDRFVPLTALIHPNIV